MEVLVVVGFVVLLIWSLIQSASTQQRRDENLDELVAEHAGERKRRGWLQTKERVHFRVEGSPATLEFEAGDNAHTRLQIEWAPPGSLRLDPEGVLGSLRKMFGAQDIQLGDRTFDDAFVVQGDPETWVREVLDDPTREVVLELQRTMSTLRLDVNPTGVYLTVRGRDLSSQRFDLRRLIDGGSALLRRLQGTTGTRVQVSVQEVIRAGKCPVCSDAEGDLSKRCSTCDTAYHPECWDYLGRCAILGCGDSREQRRERQLDW